MWLGDELHVTNSVNSQLILLSLKNLGWDKDPHATFNTWLIFKIKLNKQIWIFNTRLGLFIAYVWWSKSWKNVNWEREREIK